MKRILIVGKGSYIGTSFERWLAQWPDQYQVDTVDTMNDSWREHSFSEYDSVLHVAGIAHVKETKKNTGLYYKVNRDLTYEVALRAKTEGVKQFIFLSSMSVYGIESGIIDRETPPTPKSNYGKSKLQAEELITSLRDDAFNIAVLRPPMVYGKGCKGNYSKLAKIALIIPVFPDVDNQRSMIYIDNLCELMRLLVNDSSGGLYFPQNYRYVKTSEMVRTIAEFHGKRIKFTKLFNPLLRFLMVGIVKKVFGNLIYDEEMSHDNKCYCIVHFKESIRATELEV